LIVARLGPVFGPWERTTGTRDTPSPHLQAARLAAAGRRAILPHPGRADWIYSRDVATGVVTLLDADRPRHRVYNVGAGGAWPGPLARQADGSRDARGRAAPPPPERPPPSARRGCTMTRMRPDTLATALGRMARAVSETLELKEVFARVAEAAATVLPFDTM